MDPCSVNSSMMDMSTAAPEAPAGDRPAVERRRRLSPAALRVSNQKVRPAYSPIVIAGGVRVADFLLLTFIGIALYLGYVARTDGFSWGYVAAIVTITAAAVICFQASDIYQVQVFRGQLRQMTRMVSSWTFVFLLFIGASFFAKLGDAVSRVWLSGFFLVGLAALIAERVALRGLVRRWAREGRLDRRTIVVGSDESGKKLIELLNAQDDSDLGILGVFDDRNDARAQDTCAGSPKLGKVDDIVEFARRTRIDLVLFALPTFLFAVVSFFDYDRTGIYPAFIPDNYRDLLTTPSTIRVYVSSLTFAVIVWAITLFLGFNIAHFLIFHVRSAAVRTVLFLLCAIPFWTSGIIRTIAWIPFLGRNGAFNQSSWAPG